MNTSFGPWTTSFNVGPVFFLSALWRSRLERLPATARHRGVISLRMLAGLWVVGTLLCGLPTLRGTALLAEPKPVEVEKPKRPLLRPSPVSKAESAIYAKLTEPFEFDFVETPLEDALNFLRDAGNLNLRLDKDAIKQSGIDLDAPVTIHCPAPHFDEMLRFLLEPMQLGWIVDGNALIVTTRTKADSHINEWEYDVIDLVKRDIKAGMITEAISTIIAPDSWSRAGGKGTIQENQETIVIRQTRPVHGQIQHLLKMLRDSTDPDFEKQVRSDDALVLVAYKIDDLLSGKFVEDAHKPRLAKDLIEGIQKGVLPSTWGSTGGKGEIQFGNGALVVKQYRWAHVRLAESLDFYRRVFLRNDGLLAISNVRHVSEMIADPDGAEERAFYMALNRQVDVDFEDIRLNEVLETLSNQYGIHLIYDRERLEKARISPETRIKLKLSSVSLRSALKLILEPLKLDWKLSGPPAIVWVTTREHAAAGMTVHVYRIQDLIQAGQTVPGMTDKIVKSVGADAWDSMGGPGSLRALPGVFVVRQNRQGHDKIESVLSELKNAAKK